jgi:DNA damage-inducible protein 1
LCVEFVAAMQLTCVTQNEKIVSVDMDPADPVDNLKAIIEAETGQPSHSQDLFLAGKLLQDGQSLGSQGVQDGDMIMVAGRAPAPVAHAPVASGPASAGGGIGDMDSFIADPQRFIDMLRSRPDVLAGVPPALAQAATRNDAEAMGKMLLQVKNAREDEARFLRLAEEDPFNPEVQTRLEEAIRRKNVEENLVRVLHSVPMKERVPALRCKFGTRSQKQNRCKPLFM